MEWEKDGILQTALLLEFILWLDWMIYHLFINLFRSYFVVWASV